MPAAQINQPSNQIKLTNVSLVKLRKGKKRFEVPAYKNTVSAFRSGAETDLDNILQIPNVFLNVSKGQVAPNEELKKAFPGMTRDQIILEILNKGEVQVGEKERAVELERVQREVVELVSGRLVDPKSKRVYTTGMIEKALDQLSSAGGHAATSGGRLPGKGRGGGDSSAERSASRDQSAPSAATTAESPTTNKASKATNGTPPDSTAEATRLPIWKGVTTTRSAKSQALDAIKALIAHQPIPVARARMRLRITCPNAILKQSVKTKPIARTNDDEDEGESQQHQPTTVKEKILSYIEQVESQDLGSDEWEVVGFVEPGNFKLLGDFIGAQTKGRARAEVLDMAVTHHEGD